MEVEDRVLKHVWDRLDSLEIGETVKVKDEAPNRPDIYIHCAKKYFDCYRTIRFNRDYTAIKKVNPILTFKQQIEDYELTSQITTSR